MEFEHNVGHLLCVQGYVEERVCLIYLCVCVQGLRTPHKYYSKGETYHGPYHCNKGTGVVTGNPALFTAAQDMMEVLKNNEGAEGGSRNHVSAMTIEDMQKLMAWSYSQCPDGIVSHVHQSIKGRSTLDMADVILAQQHLMVCTFLTTEITIWTWYTRF